MSIPISKAQAVAFITESFRDIEVAIRQHPTETVQKYEEAALAHRQGMDTAEETEWSRSIGLSLDDLNLVHRYLFATAFMSAWWHLHGDKHRRDKAAQSASMLVSTIGINPEVAMRHLLRYENAFRGSMGASYI